MRTVKSRRHLPTGGRVTAPLGKVIKSLDSQTNNRSPRASSYSSTEHSLQKSDPIILLPGSARERPVRSSCCVLWVVQHLLQSAAGSWLVARVAVMSRRGTNERILTNEKDPEGTGEACASPPTLTLITIRSVSAAPGSV